MPFLNNLLSCSQVVLGSGRPREHCPRTTGHRGVPAVDSDRVAGRMALEDAPLPETRPRVPLNETCAATQV
jgi:hypothetical protein